jgi:hypothetical protein
MATQDNSLGHLRRRDLRWHERPVWFLLSSALAGVAAAILGLELIFGFPQYPALWLVFLFLLAGWHLGISLGRAYLDATRQVWQPGTLYRPLWRARVGRQVLLQLALASGLALAVSARLVPLALPSSLPPETIGFIAAALVAIFELTLGSAMLVPVYRWLSRLPE